MKKVIIIIGCSVLLLTSIFFGFFYTVPTPTKYYSVTHRYNTNTVTRQTERIMVMTPRKKTPDWNNIIKNTGSSLMGIAAFLVMLSNITGYTLKDLINKKPTNV